MDWPWRLACRLGFRTAVVAPAPTGPRSPTGRLIAVKMYSMLLFSAMEWARLADRGQSIRGRPRHAELPHKALKLLGTERPVLVGHSWGAIVALSLAARHPADTAGLVLLSGYYFWTLRPDVLLVTAGAVPVLGDILRHTASPWLGRL